MKWKIERYRNRKTNYVTHVAEDVILNLEKNCNNVRRSELMNIPEQIRDVGLNHNNINNVDMGSDAKVVLQNAMDFEVNNKNNGCVVIKMIAIDASIEKARRSKTSITPSAEIITHKGIIYNVKTLTYI